MKAKNVTIVFVTTILALIWCSAAWADRFNVRDHRQTRRIRQGIRSGEITRPETRRLVKEQHRIDRAYRRAMTDGHLNRGERLRLNHMQDRASRHIYWAKHNASKRRPHRHYHKGAHRAFHHRHASANNHNIKGYYPVPGTYRADGYAFSMGVCDLGWQFNYFGWNR